MVDAATRTAPIPAQPAEFPGVTIALAAPLARYSLRARDPAVLADLLGLDLPARIGTTTGTVIKLGPDEWLARLPAGTAPGSADGQPCSVADVSERSIGIELTGARALAVLSAGCPRNLALLGIGEGRRTVFEGVEVIILREAETRYVVEVWRSFAPWLWTALTTVAAHD
jgi:sarcosine oxidase subunit gamma